MLLQPHFNHYADFFHMGGYARYVWPAYGICLLVLIAQVIHVIIKAHEKASSKKII